MMLQGLIDAIALAGGQTQLANKIGKRQSNVSTWVHRAGRVPADQVIAVAEATDWRVRPCDLRPDIYPHADDGMPERLRGGVQRSSCR